MSEAWAAVLAVGVGTAVLKSVGPVAVAGRRLPDRVTGLLTLLAPALLAALVVVEAFGRDRSLAVDPRLAGAGAGLVAVLLRAPIWLVVLAGAVATALARGLS